MSSFGFSAGDFVAAIHLIHKIALALDDSKGASSEFQELKEQLTTADNILRQVQALELENEQNSEAAGLRQATAKLHETIERFHENHIKRYDPILPSNGAGSSSLARVKGSYTKVKWAVLKKEELQKFKDNVKTEIDLITLQMVVVHANAMSIRGRKREEQRDNLASQVQGVSKILMKAIVYLSKTLDRGFRDVVQAITSTSSANKQLQMQILAHTQKLVTMIPAQMSFPEPVYFTDAFGRCTPFHLNFVQGTEILISFLRHNCEQAGADVRKIDRGQFVLEDAVTKRVIDLRRGWESCFRPGQRVEMSIVYETVKLSASAGAANITEGNSDNCGLQFQRFEDVTDSNYLLSPDSLTPEGRMDGFPLRRVEVFPPQLFLRLPCPTNDLPVDYIDRKSMRIVGLGNKNEGSREHRRSAMFKRVRVIPALAESERCRLYQYAELSWNDIGLGYAHVDRSGVSWDPELALSNTALPPLAAWSASNLGNIFVSPSRFNSSDIACHYNAAPGALHIDTTTGAELKMQWNDCADAHKDALEWVKIEQLGWLNGTGFVGLGGTWASDVLIANHASWIVKIPEALAGGNYVLRHEIIALHVAEEADGAQAYPQCVNLRVAGGRDGKRLKGGVVAEKE
ncbi:lytic polysaccharide monooxygenase [Lentithecium fluviatile CBS 122367]|uniref:AA9 family lytic polysaccharide monooxygenase n=1 Tax=Lentithecium fluviatile CBS 122367 TaxID=1168545 RepID=A0A6G1JNG0_9PLEO|nr:lytic polysaccharide monooxygenase [Lentithecium fluviatile CBS 122367]